MGIKYFKKLADKSLTISFKIYPFFIMFRTTAYFTKFIFKLGQVYFGKVYDPIEYFVCRNKNLIYIVNSKVACSSIKKALLESEGFKINELVYNEIHKIAKENDFSKYTLDEIHKSYKMFCVVRNPFERMVSLYINKFEDQKKIAKVGYEYHRYLGGIFQQDDSFADFIHKIELIPDRFADRHFKSQHFLLNEEAKGNVEYFKIEKITQLNHFLHSHDIVNLPSANRSNLYDYKEYYTKELAEIVYRRFKKDIEEFDYTEEYKNLLSYINKNNEQSKCEIDEK